MRNSKILGRIMIIVLSIIIISAGCDKTNTTKKNLTFVGEGNHWSAVYHIDGNIVFTETKGQPVQYNGQGEGTLVLTYKGELPKLYTVRNLSYSLEGSGHKSETKMQLKKPLTSKVFTDNTSNIATIWTYNQDTIIKVVVSWDGDTGGMEEIELKSR